MLGTPISKSDSSQDESSRPQIRPAKFLQFWKKIAQSPAFVPPSCSPSIIPAVNALIVPLGLIVPHIRPVGPFVAAEDDFWLAWLKRLGAKEVVNDEYIRTHLLPTIQANPSVPELSGDLLTILNFMITESRTKGVRGGRVHPETYYPYCYDDVQLRPQIGTRSSAIFLSLSTVTKSCWSHNSQKVL